MTGERTLLKLPAAREALPSGRTCRECARCCSSNCLRAPARVSAKVAPDGLNRDTSCLNFIPTLSGSKWANKRGRKPLETHQSERISENYSNGRDKISSLSKKGLHIYLLAVCGYGYCALTISTKYITSQGLVTLENLLLGHSEYVPPS